MRAFHQGRIAFVFCPLGAETFRLDTMPFAAYIVRQLAASGHQIDLFLWSKPVSFDSIGLCSANVHFRYVNSDTRSKMKLIELTLRFARSVTYKCVFAVGLMGSYYGGVISAASRCPFVLVNDELPSEYNQSPRLILQRWAARRADAIVVPSDDRYAPLIEELRLTGDVPFVTIRNTPEVALPFVDVDWHSLIGIPHGKKIFINAGRIGDWAQVPEILASVSYWPEDAVLLLHNGRTTRDDFARYRREVSHLDIPKKVFWSFDILPEDRLNSLINSCSGSFALYRNSGPNIEIMGTSSGKLMRSIVCGTPVIASSFRSLNFVTSEGRGIQVTHPAEIPVAIENLIRNRESYRERCTRFGVSEEVLRKEAWDKIVECIRNASNGVDLSSPDRKAV